ncbi:MAG: GTP-binding protein [Flavobacteria bacterium RIFCSPLOWO2_12_FULL_31_7]|nr:MAG: GTP-binding protein [Flavobacteria bacterium RIFCSPLOWO2_12_FULL_31_7]
MEKAVPDNVVYSEEKGYNASFLPYATSVGAPIIKVDDVAAWKSRGVRNVNKEFENKFKELKQQYQSLMEEFEWNELIYNSKFSFEPIIGETYHLYTSNGSYFLSLIPPHEWNKEHIGTFQLNSDKKWVKQN